MKNKLIALIAGLTLCSNVHAANGFPEDEFTEDDMLFDEEEILISATGYSKPARLAPSVATIITAAEIKEMGATTIFEALESVPGIHVYPNKDLLASKLSIRGVHTSDGAQTLFLRNGQPIKNANVSSIPGAFRAPVSNIARIEVIRGPGSAVHGADALAGVINIVTKDAHEINGVDLGGRMGSFNSNSTWVQYGKKYADWDIAFSLEQMRTGGDPDRMVDIDTADPALSYAPDHLETGYEYYETSLYLRNENWDIDFWHWQQREGGTGPGAAHALDPVGNEDYQYYQFDISYTFRDLLPNLELKPNFNYVYQDTQRNFVLLPPGSGGGSYPNGMIGDPGLEDRTYTINITGTYNGFEQRTLRIDLGYSRQELDTNETKNFNNSFAPMPLTEVADTSLVYLPDTDRENYFLSFQDEWRISKEWIFTGGLRYDHYNDFGKTINPRLALIWSPPMPLTTKLLYGSAFRAPSLQELYITKNPVIEGNDGLDPETIDTLELAFEYFPLLELNSRLSLFYYEMDDTIEVVSAKYQNTEGQRSYGFELETEWDITNQLELRSSFAWQHTEMKNGGSRVPKAPGREFHFAANWRFMPDWTIDTQVNWIGGRKRPAGESRGKLDNFTIVDLTLRKTTPDRSWGFALSAKNLFDKQSFEWGDNPTNAFGAVLGDYELQGRSVYAEMSYHFR